MKVRDFILITSAAVGTVFLGGSWWAIGQAFDESFREHAARQAEDVSRLTFATMYEVMSQGWSREQAERFVATVRGGAQGQGLKVQIYRGAPVEASHGPISQPGLGPDVLAALERGQRHESFDGAIYRSTFPLKAEARCLSCHTNAQVGTVLGAIEVSQPYGALLEKAHLEYYRSALPSLLLALLLAGTAVWWVSRKISHSVTGVETSLQSINNLSDLRQLVVGNGEHHFNEIERINAAISSLASRLRSIAVDKDILMFEIGLLEKFVITSDVIRDWRIYVGHLLHEINSLVKAQVLFSVFQLGDELFDIEIFWHCTPDEASKKLVEQAISDALKDDPRFCEAATIHIHHQYPASNESSPAAFDSDQFTLRVKSFFVDQPKIGGIVGIGVQADALLDHTHHLVLDSILSTLLNVVGSIKAIHKYTRDLEYYATRDPLTDLFNQRVFWEMLNYEIGRCQRHSTKTTLLVIDLDNFKLINDHYGHATGDVFLQQIARSIRGALRAGDIFARYGGDEFAIVLPEADLEQGYIVAQRVLEAARQATLDAPDSSKIHASVSIGLAVYPDHATESKDMFLFADNMMYRAKAEGKERVALPTNEDVMAVFRDVSEMGVAVLAAVNERRVIPFFQPIADVATGELAAVEVLSRLEVNGELLRADQFIEVAEKMGIIHRLDALVIEAALAQVKKSNFEGYIFFNLSPRALVLSEFAWTLRTVVQQSGIPPERIVFEITERDTVKNLSLLERFFGDLKAEGFGLAIDDFGSGFSSFHYLRRFPFDFLKIEGDFIANMPHSDRDRIFVRSMSDLARALNIRVVAEFVESPEVLTMLKELGIDFAQGYHVGRPDRDIRQPATRPALTSSVAS